MSRLIQATWILPIILSCASFCLASLNLTYEFKYIDYVWESDDQKTSADEAGTYDYKKIIPNDIQPLADGRILVTLPKYFDNPASLATISDVIDESGPLLAPYPNWAWHQKSDCSGITSVNRVFIDDYNTLWLVDSGKIENKQVCQAKILAFDPETDEVVQQVLIPTELSHNSKDVSQGRLEIVGVEVTENKSYAYISDVDGFGLLIFDGTDIWRLEADVYRPEADASIFSINEEDITLNIGPSGVLTPVQFLKEQFMLFKPMSSTHAYGVSLEDLHKSKSGSNITYYRSNFVEPSQELSRAFSKSGGILIGGFTAGVIACWNLQYPLEEAYLGVLDTTITNLQFVSGIKITEDSSTGSQTVWAVSNKLQQVITESIDWDAINFRILTGDLATLVAGTVCEPLEEYEVQNSITDKQILYYETASNTLVGSYSVE